MSTSVIERMQLAAERLMPPLCQLAWARADKVLLPGSIKRPARPDDPHPLKI